MKMSVFLMLLVASCDDMETANVEGLRARLDAIAAEQSALGGRLDALGANVDAPNACEDVEAELAATKSRLGELDARVAKLEGAPKSDAPLSRPAGPDPLERYKVEVDDAFVRGRSDAKITLVIFGDFQCPFCRSVQSTIRELEAHYGNDLRFVAKHNPLPFHKQAELAAQAAEAAGKQGKFFEMHDRLYENARDITEAKLDDWAKELGLDVRKFRRDLNSAGVLARIKAHKQQAATLRARSTPSFFVNGRYLKGGPPLEQFKKLIDEELAEVAREKP